MKQAKSFQLDIVSSSNSTDPQMVQLIMWAADPANPAQPFRYEQLISLNDSSIQSLLIEYNKLLASIKAANGVS